MTLDELLGIGRHLLNSDREEMRELGQGILDLLGESAPCGFEPPCTDQPGVVAILAGDGDPMYEFTPGEARTYAAMLLRAADESEAA